MVTNPALFDAIHAQVPAQTLRQAEDGLANAEHNRPFIAKTIRDLVGQAAGRTCLIVSGGPSLLRRRSLERIKPVIDRFVVVAADGALGHCLRAGIVPNYVLSLDPHAERITRWFGDDDLTAEKLEDDYFRRQDLDQHFNQDEVERNEEQIRLVNAAGPSITAVLATSAAVNVRRRCFDSGMDVYWWNPIYDDFSEPDSLTRRLYEANKVPCMNAGGNVGSAALIFAVRVLGAADIAMVGLDFAYYADTPLRSTQYYDQFMRTMGEDEIPDAFKTIRNPHLDEDYYTDPAYYWYRQGLLELVDAMKGCRIVNATEGGILFGKGIEWQSLDQVMASASEEGTRP